MTLARHFVEHGAAVRHALERHSSGPHPELLQRPITLDADARRRRERRALDEPPHLVEPRDRRVREAHELAPRLQASGLGGRAWVDAFDEESRFGVYAAQHQLQPEIRTSA